MSMGEITSHTGNVNGCVMDVSIFCKFLKVRLIQTKDESYYFMTFPL